MELGQLIVRFRELVSEVARQKTNFAKDGSTRKTVAYKKRKLDEINAVWTSLEMTMEEIDRRLKTPDACYTQEKEDVTKMYNDLVSKLEAIPDEGTYTDDDAKKLEADLLIQLNKQEVRFESLHKIISDVEEKMRHGQSVSCAYAKLKDKQVNDIWTRITIEDENLVGDREALPRKYIDKLNEYAVAVEQVCLFIQNEIEVNPRMKSEGVKLQRVKIPRFEGDYFKWTSFRDLFTTMIIDNGALSDGQRMQMLKTTVGGEAEALISDLTIANANFEGAWQRLISRYDNSRVVIYKHLNQMISQESAKNDSRAVRRLLDTTEQILMALKNLGRPTDSWDDWIVLLISQKLSEEGRRDWEKRVGSSVTVPTWNELRQFLEDEFRMLESIENGRLKKNEKFKEPMKSYQISMNDKQCPACSGEHKLFNCSAFKKMEVRDRWRMAKNKKLCFGCLKSHSKTLVCEKKNPCSKCEKRHSTWLHDERPRQMEKVSVKNPDQMAVNIATSTMQVLLATVAVLVRDKLGRMVRLRGLLDSGSQGCIITERAAAYLQLKTMKTDRHISGVGGIGTNALKKVLINAKPHFESNFEMEFEGYVMKKLTKTLPDTNLDVEKWSHIKNLTWADPSFNQVGPIDLLMGMDVIAQIMKPGIRRGALGEPIAQETSLGWIMAGNIDQSYQQRNVTCLIATTKSEEVDLSKFWEVEELHPKRTLTTDEKWCEEFYERTHQRKKDGKFMVKIPFKPGKDGPESLGSSRGQCMARFLQLERKLKKDEKLRNEYVRVMEEYITLGHMKSVTADTQRLYYIPHHAVLKPDSLTTKTRVVFDASAKTSSGRSLNECMWTGAKQQEDIFQILMRWRKHEIVFKADIEKMYRKIELDPEDQQYHTILWRKEPNEPIKEYQITTVTFGTAAAPFLATRTLKQLAFEHREEYPLASDIVENDFYVDDLISGCSSLSRAKKAKDELIHLLQRADMKLRKWSSNSEELLQSLPAGLTEKSLQMFSEDDSTKTLGLRWNPRTDTFNFLVKWDQTDIKLTKRQLLSEASKLFDPLGWLAPVIVTAKMIMQEVWLSEIGWDDEVPTEVKLKWMKFKGELPTLSYIKITRWLRIQQNCDISIHGFCDASEKAFAAVIYTRVKQNGEVFIKLIAAKTRVASVKTKLTLPKLELCGATLMGGLITAAQESLQLQRVPVYAWSDSMVALGWISGSPSKWKTFVANRVADIQARSIENWNYMKSEENPADCASRGILPSELKEHTLWWSGPEWLKNEPDSWQVRTIDEPEDERRNLVVCMAMSRENEIIDKISSWNKLLRFTAYAMRWKVRKTGFLTAEELGTARKILLKKCQAQAFPSELRSLKKGNSVEKTSCLVSMHPFIDQNGIMRVGGRLTNAKIAFENKHPVILPAKHHMTDLIVRQYHLDTLHGGPQMMRNLIQKQYWIIQGKRLMNREYNQCVVCKRYNQQNHAQIMGNLPEARVTLERGFLQTGVDYAGPIELKSSKLKSARIIKAYVALYVCLGTRAIHLELVSDNTKEAFLASFNRFIARRGLPTEMYSDNGGAFQGGCNVLSKKEREWFHERNVEVANRVANKGIKWNFIPPGSPNFGGIWERGVRSMKEHLKKTLKTARLTFEEYNTLLCQIEACLNSRPLCPLTEDKENLNVLTPGHFLIGEALMAPPQPLLLDNTANRVRRWTYVQLLQQQFWQRWNQEYLLRLQQRHKWNQTSRNIKVGDMVLVKDEQLPPKNWLVGRIEETHPGSDGQVRVASVRVADPGYPKTKKIIIMKRSVRKLCPLVNDELDEKDKELDLINTKIPSTLTRSKALNMTHWMYLILGVMMMLGGVFGNSSGKTSISPIQIEKFENRAGIYFENFGRANLLRSEWHMVSYFDLKNYKQEIKMTNDVIIELKILCAKINQERKQGHCTEIVTRFFEKMQDLKRLNELISSNKELETIYRRKRSAPLAVVGWLGNKLFGIMDEEHAEHLESQIELIDENEEHSMTLMKKQTSLVETTLGIMQSTTEEITRNIGMINIVLKRIVNETNEAQVMEQFLGWTIQISLVIDKLERRQQQMMTILTEIQQGHVNSYMFPPEQFRKQISVIVNHLPPETKLPGDVQNDLRNFYELLHGTTRVTERYLIVDLTFPLVSKPDYEIFHIHPVPTLYNGKRVSIVPESEYLLITLKRDNFYQLNQTEFNTCLKVHGGTTICKMQRPIYTVQAEEAKCERELLEQTTVLNNKCQLRMSNERDVWIQLQKGNKWIYDLKEKATLNAICQNKIHTQSIQDTGIMTIMPGCEVTCNKMTIIAESRVVHKENINFQPSWNLSDKIQLSETELFIPDIETHHQQQFEIVREQIKEVKAQRKLCKILTPQANASIRNDSNDVEQHDHDNFEMIDQGSKMKEVNRPEITSSTSDRHKAGECPFRT